MSERRHTSDLIREFSRAFGRPVNDHVVELTVTERELLGKLIFEECVEYVTLGLGLKIIDSQTNFVVAARKLVADGTESYLKLELDEGQRYDPIESADGLADMEVVIHFNSNWHGFDLDEVLREVHESNMSKLDENGKPIINQCGLDDPCRVFQDYGDCDHLIDLSKPAGKILKSPNYRPPNIAAVIGPLPEGLSGTSHT